MSNRRNELNQKIGSFWEKDDTLIIIGGFAGLVWILHKVVIYFV